MWFADWRKIKIKSFKKLIESLLPPYSYPTSQIYFWKFTISILISHISNLLLEGYYLNTHISHLTSNFGRLLSQYSYLTSQIYFWKFTISILISHISNLFWKVYHLNTHISHLKSIKQEKPILLGDGLFLFYNAYAPNCTRLKAVTVNPLATESKN